MSDPGCTGDQAPLTESLGIGLTAKAALSLHRGENIVTSRQDLSDLLIIRPDPGAAVPAGPGAGSPGLWLVVTRGRCHLHLLLHPHPASPAAGDRNPADLQHLLHHCLD